VETIGLRLSSKIVGSHFDQELWGEDQRRRFNAEKELGPMDGYIMDTGMGVEYRQIRVGDTAAAYTHIRQCQSRSHLTFLLGVQ